MEIIIGLVLLYILQAVLIYGMTYAYFEGEYLGYGHRGIAMFVALHAGMLPIVGPAMIFCLSGFATYGLRYK